MSKQFDKQFKENAVQYYLAHKELGWNKCAENLGISRNAIRSWVKAAAENAGEVPIRGAGNYANAAGKSFAAQVNNVAGTPKVYNIFSDEDMIWTGGNGTGLSYYLKYAEDSTEDDPTIIAKGVDENGDEFEKTIHINEVNPKSATVVEMRALEAHMGVKKLGGFTSLPMEAGAMGLNDRTDFMDMFQKQIGDMKLLLQKKTAAYYQYSMQAYWDFMNKK